MKLWVISMNGENALRMGSLLSFLAILTRENGDEPGGKGFGLASLKTVPKGFPRDYESWGYLRMKDYCCWHAVSDDFF